MILLPVLAAVATLATRGTLAIPPCPDETTLGSNRCWSGRLAKADSELARYLATARIEVKRRADSPDGPKTADALRQFDVAQKAWSAYRDAECGAIFDYWSGGTIRDLEALACRTHLATLRTHTIWLHWLTFMDSTPPLLPEPSVPPN
jgi:uncharacterized protein YecT (DUF1311 family)